jgi:hypothetical protein
MEPPQPTWETNRLDCSSPLALSLVDRPAPDHSSDTLTVDAIDLAQARRNHRYRDHSHTAAAEVRKVYP